MQRAIGKNFSTVCRRASLEQSLVAFDDVEGALKGNRFNETVAFVLYYFQIWSLLLKQLIAALNSVLRANTHSKRLPMQSKHSDVVLFTDGYCLLCCCFMFLPIISCGFRLPALSEHVFVTVFHRPNTDFRPQKGMDSILALSTQEGIYFKLFHQGALRRYGLRAFVMQKLIK